MFGHLGAGMFEHWDVWVPGCLGAGMFGCHDVLVQGCLGARRFSESERLFVLQDVWARDGGLVSVFFGVSIKIILL